MKDHAKATNNLNNISANSDWQKSGRGWIYMILEPVLMPIDAY
jgi:hypothetical protein